MFAISITAMLIAFSNIVMYKFKIREYILMTSLITIIYTILYFINTRIASVAEYCVPAIFIYIKSKKIIKSIMLQIIICSTIIITDSSVSYMMLNLFDSNLLESFSGYLIYCIIVLTVLLLLSRKIGKLLVKYHDRIIESYKYKYLALSCIILVATFFLFYVNINWNNSSDPIYLEKANGFVFFIYGIILVITLLSILFLSKREEKFKHNQIELANLREYTENLENLYTDMRKFRHDYINIISSIASYIEDNDINGIKKYFNKHIYPLNNEINKNNYKLGLLKNMKISEIKGILSVKIIHAQELGIDVVLDMVEEINYIDMDIIDLCRSLGIILDNAIDAALESEQKSINIGFIKKNKSIIMVVTNTFKGQINSISKLFNQGFSTKGNNRGLGLSNLKEILSKYKFISLDTYVENERFVQEITVLNR